MKIRDLKAVIVDDAAVKSIHIKRALQFCGVENIVMFDHQEALWEYLETSEADLIVTDMHYPLAKGEKENEEAGFILLEKMKQREHPIPVIICSSQNYRSPDALGTVWYNKLRDIEFDFKNSGFIDSSGIGELTAHIFGYKIIEGLPLVCKKDSFFINDYL